MNTYKHLTKEERWTTFRELKRNTSSTGIYYSLSAHKKYIRRKFNFHLFSMFKYKNFTVFFYSKI